MARVCAGLGDKRENNNSHSATRLDKQFDLVIVVMELI